MTGNSHAVKFLLPLEPAYSVRRIGRAILDAAADDPEVAATLNEIQQRLGNGQVIIDAEHWNIFERVKSARTLPQLPTAPDWLAPLIVAAYLRAKQAATASSAGKILEDPKRSLARVLQLAEKLEPSFFGELLVETALAARDDRGFSRTLHEGAVEFRALVDDLYGRTAPGDVAAESGSTVMARMSGGGGGDEGCIACADTGGTVTCTPVSCWLIVIVIVVIIVAK